MTPLNPDAPWEALAEESHQAYEAFSTYRNLGPKERSLLKTWRILSGKDHAPNVPGKITSWSDRHEWVQRARAYDAHLERLERAKAETDHLREITAFRDRARRGAAAAADLTLALMTKIAGRLKEMKPEDITPAMMPSYLRAVASMLDTSLNAEAEAIGVREWERQQKVTPDADSRDS